MNTTSDTPEFNHESYRSAYNEESFWDKLRAASSKIGETPLKLALKAYFVMTDTATPVIAKGLVAGALGYLISPLDLIPDILIPVGYTDDALVLAAALAGVAAHVKPEHTQRATDKAREFFN